jgi:hypothetical protein
MEKEQWIDIKGYEGIYQVSNTGKVKSLIGNKIKIRKPKLDNKGYYQINLHKNNKSKTFRLHRLVAESFIPNTSSKPFVNHKNFIKTDNSIDNLEWSTPLENTRHYIYNGEKNRKRPYENKTYERVKFSMDDLNEMHKLYLSGFTLSQIAEQYNIRTMSVIQVLLSYMHPEY